MFSSLKFCSERCRTRVLLVLINKFYRMNILSRKIVAKTIQQFCRYTSFLEIWCYVMYLLREEEIMLYINWKCCACFQLHHLREGDRKFNYRWWCIFHDIKKSWSWIRWSCWNLVLSRNYICFIYEHHWCCWNSLGRVFVFW